ncbi:MAG: hypothetical protein A2Z77_01985 [Chloroflexi bacterium RBG_13_51_36]|nr:MAG: hypothetical protein A2Z77_01985 [Chloroflexi bacterium RBG_13_51_36]
MASNGSKGGLLTAGGILSIVGGALEVIGGLVIVALAIGARILLRLGLPPMHPGDWFEHVMPFIPVIPMWLVVVGGPLLVLGVVAIVGGVSAVRRQSFGLSLAGAICALPSPTIPLGILAVIFVSLSRREFEAGN